MAYFFSALFFLSIAGFVAGLIRPRLFKMKSRKYAATIFSGAIVVSFILLAITLPDSAHTAPQVSNSLPSVPHVSNTQKQPDTSQGTGSQVQAQTQQTPSAPQTQGTAASEPATQQDTSATSNTSTPTYGVRTKTSGCVANQVLQDPACTPGDVLTTSISTICVSGYTQTVRNVPLSEKEAVFAEYGISYSDHSNYEVDHLISLELGGSNDISNLWPESSVITDDSFTKDKLENYLHAQVCSGALALTDAQSEISSNWLEYYTIDILHQTYTGPSPSSNPTTTSPPATQTGPETKKSTSGICHEQGTQYYNQTKIFTPYDSLAACLASGGRLPK